MRGHGKGDGDIGRKACNFLIDIFFENLGNQKMQKMLYTVEKVLAPFE